MLGNQVILPARIGVPIATYAAAYVHTYTYIHTHEISPMRLAYGTALVRRNLRKGGRGEADMGGEFGMGCE